MTPSDQSRTQGVRTPALLGIRLPTVDERAAEARQRRLAAEGATPAKADDSRWDDPNDTVNTKSPRQVRGYRRGDHLGKLHRRGEDVTRDHLEAASRFRCDWDIAMLGLSSGAGLLDKVSGSAAGPVLGPNAQARERAARQRDLARVVRLIGPAALPLLLWVVIENHDVAAWCRMEAERTAGPKPDAKKELGKLIATLNRLAEVYGIDSRRDAVKQARKELHRR